jgi:hypothetical protein
MGLILRCLSVRQPWASAIALGLKPVENRPQNRKYRGPLLIQAGSAPDRNYDASVELIERLSGRRLPDEIRFGGIVGAVNLVDCKPPLRHDDGRWRFAGQYGLEFERAITLPFRAIKGSLGLFRVELTPSEEQALRGAGLIP